MTKPGSEERYPLLLLYVEENGRKSEFPQRVVFTDKGRGKEVSQGAAAIITQWPAQVTSCWLTSVALGTAFIFISLLLLMSSLNPLYFPIHPRCTRDTIDEHCNKTIHLVKHGNNWSHKQLDVLRFIADSYPDFEIRNIMLDTSLKNFKKREKKKRDTKTSTTEREHYHFHIPDFTNTFVKKLNEMLKKDKIITKDDEATTKEKEDTKAETTEDNVIPSASNSTASANRIKRSVFFKFPNHYEDILDMYPNIIEQKITYKDYFEATPLHYFWVDFSPEMILFSVRVLELWQKGGISFYLPDHNHHEHQKKIEIIRNINKTMPSIHLTNKTNILPKIPPNNNVNIARLKLLISSTKFRFDKLTEDLVSIDGQGLHMATKIPCHSFFGEMIIKLQKDIEKLTVSDFIQRILNVFCGRGAVDSEYCLKNKK